MISHYIHNVKEISFHKKEKLSNDTITRDLEIKLDNGQTILISLFANSKEALTLR